MFDITSSRDFLEKLEADYADYMKEPSSARLALNPRTIKGMGMGRLVEKKS